MKRLERSFSLRSAPSLPLLRQAAPALLALAVCCEPETRPLNDFYVGGRSDSEKFASGGSSGGPGNATTALGGAFGLGALGGAPQKPGEGPPGGGMSAATAAGGEGPNDDGSLIAGAAGYAGADGGSGPSEFEECGSDSMCQDVQRPFCDALHRCVACKQNSDCPSSSSQCFSLRCVLGECREAPEAAGAACGSAIATECDARDSCDGAGTCQANVSAEGTPCGSSVATVCEGPDRCDGAGSCRSNLAAQGTPCTDDGLFCNGAEECDGAGRCGHTRPPCASSGACDEATKSCACDPAIVVVLYCGLMDEAGSRAAIHEAESACEGCGDGNTSYQSVSRHACTEFHCLP